MKKLSLALLVLLTFSVPLKAQENEDPTAQMKPMTKKIICGSMLPMLKELSKDKFSPRVISEFEVEKGKVLTTVFVDPNNDMIIVETKIAEDNTAMSCVVSMGSHAKLFNNNGEELK